MSLRMDVNDMIGKRRVTGLQPIVDLVLAIRVTSVKVKNSA